MSKPIHRQFEEAQLSMMLVLMLNKIRAERAGDEVRHWTFERLLELHREMVSTTYQIAAQDDCAERGGA